MKKFFTSPLFTPIVFVVCWGLFLATVLLYFPEQKFAITEDGAIIELITNIGYISMIAALLYFCRDYSNKITSWGIYLFLGICAFLREAGIQHHLSRTDSTPFKSRFFLNPDNPIGEKIVFGMILLLVFGCLVYLAIKYTKHLVTSFFKLDTVTLSTAVLCCTLVFAKIADRFPGNWRKSHNDISLPREQIEIYSLLEESSEMFLPYLVIIVLAQYHLLKCKKD